MQAKVAPARGPRVTLSQSSYVVEDDASHRWESEDRSAPRLRVSPACLGHALPFSFAASVCIVNAWLNAPLSRATL